MRFINPPVFYLQQKTTDSQQYNLLHT